MKKVSIAKDGQDIPELKREQLGAGVRGKYFQRTMRGSNVVVLEPEIQKAFPTSEAVNKALASLLAFTKKTQSLTARSTRTARRRTRLCPIIVVRASSLRRVMKIFGNFCRQDACTTTRNPFIGQGLVFNPGI